MEDVDMESATEESSLNDEGNTTASYFYYFPLENNLTVLQFEPNAREDGLPKQSEGTARSGSTDHVEMGSVEENSSGEDDDPAVSFFPFNFLWKHFDNLKQRETQTHGDGLYNNSEGAEAGGSMEDDGGSSPIGDHETPVSFLFSLCYRKPFDLYRSLNLALLEMGYAGAQKMRQRVKVWMMTK